MAIPIATAAYTDSGTDISRVALYAFAALFCLSAFRWLERRAELGFAEKCMLSLYFFVHVLPIAWEPTVHQILVLLPPTKGSPFLADVGALLVTVLGCGGVALGLFWADRWKPRFHQGTAAEPLAAAVAGFILLSLSAIGWWKLRDVSGILELYYQAGAQRYVFTSDLPAGYGRFSLLVRLVDTGLIFIGYWLACQRWRGTLFYAIVLGAIGALISSVSLGRLAILASFLAPFAGFFLKRPLPVRVDRLIIGGLLLMPAFAIYSAHFRPLSGIDNDTILQKMVVYDIGRYHIVRNLLMNEPVGSAGNLVSDLFNWSDPYVSSKESSFSAEPSHVVYSTFVIGSPSSHIVPGGIASGIVALGGYGALVSELVITAMIVAFASLSRGRTDSVRLFGILGMWYILRYVYFQSINVASLMSFFVLPFVFVYLPARFIAPFFSPPANGPR